ncbi:MAG: DUF5696 domain-containing protein [Oscillospiraceae bacterium]|jgi:hypothetical protein|nr:DUF5696 domain-containing protein [Oscillospiraceae bacterium]
MKNNPARVSAMLLSAVMLFALCLPVRGQEETASEVPGTAQTESGVLADTGLSVQNERSSLRVDTESGYLFVQDKLTGRIWQSNPSDAENDEIAVGMMRTNLRAQLIVTYIESNNTNRVNNYVASTGRGGARYEIGSDYIRAEYTFVNEGFSIPVTYRLTEDGFSARILTEKITESGACKINSIQLLPFFGAGGLEEDGYIFIPDGCGALIRFNNGKSDYSQYEKAMYGGDMTFSAKTQSGYEENLLLPVFGLKSGEGAFAAVITRGAELALLSAGVSGALCSYNRVYSSVVYRETRTVNLQDHTGHNVSSLFTALDVVSESAYEVTYHFLKKENADYAGMAAVTRDWLSERGVNGDLADSVRLFVDFYGAVQKEKAFLGIRYTGSQKLTDFSQAQLILEDLVGRGVDSITAGYRYFSADAISGKLSAKVTPCAALGSGFSQLLAWTRDYDIGLFPYADFVRFSKNGNGYSHFRGVSLGLDLSVTKRYPYSMVSNTQDKSRPAIYLAAPDKFKAAQKLLVKTLDKTKAEGVLLDESVNMLYSDFSRSGFQRDRAASAMQTVYTALRENGAKLVMSAPNAYAIPFAAQVTDCPMNSSRYLLFDEEVPVLQMVFSGLIDYSSRAVNIGGYSDEDMLRLIETSTQPKFALIYEPGSVLLRTDLDMLYGATYTDCADTLELWYGILNDIYAQTAGAEIIGHGKKDGLARTVYDNGKIVYVNYGDADAEADNGQIVKARSFCVVSEVK